MVKKITIYVILESMCLSGSMACYRVKKVNISKGKEEAQGLEKCGVRDTVS